MSRGEIRLPGDRQIRFGGTPQNQWAVRFQTRLPALTRFRALSDKFQHDDSQWPMMVRRGVFDPLLCPEFVHHIHKGFDVGRGHVGHYSVSEIEDMPRAWARGV